MEVFFSLIWVGFAFAILFIVIATPITYLLSLRRLRAASNKSPAKKFKNFISEANYVRLFVASNAALNSPDIRPVIFRYSSAIGFILILAYGVASFIRHSLEDIDFKSAIIVSKGENSAPKFGLVRSVDSLCRLDK